MSELLDRIQREIRERLEVTRAAVLEHERLEAALRALGDAGSRATRAVTGRSGSARAPEAARRSSAAARSSSPRARSSKDPSAASGNAERGTRARRAPARHSAGRSTASAGAKKGRAAGAAGVTPARKRAARGANREAVLRVIGERPGVTARELAAASQVTGGTLYALLRRLTDEGTLEKRELPGGQTGYAMAASRASAASDVTQQESTAIEASAGDEPALAAEPEQGRADSTGTDGAARSVRTEARRTQEQ